MIAFHFSGTLSSLPAEALTPLKKLKTLDLHGNKIKDLKRNQFKGLRDTEFLDLSYNMIDKLDTSHLADLVKMGWCNMSHNIITDLKRLINLIRNISRRKTSRCRLFKIAFVLEEPSPEILS